VRVNVQLIDARSDNHIWAQTYDRKLDDVFAVESEVAQKIAASLQAQLTHDERIALTTRPTDNPEAYAAYLKGRALSSHSTFDRGNLEQVIAAFQEAVKLDPNFALAWAELVEQQAWMYWEGFDPTPARLATAKAALDRAVSLAPNAPQVELAQAWFLYYGEHDFAAALTAFRRAQRGLPNDAQVWAASGFVERRLGQFDAAVADFERARGLDPNDVNPAINLAQTLSAQRRFAQAHVVIDAGLALDGNDPELWHLKLFVLWGAGDLDAVDRQLAARASDAANVLADRAMQALYRRNYASASDLFRRAAAGADDFMAPSSFGGYIPAAIDWQLQRALSEQRGGSAANAAAIYRQVKEQTRTALAAKPGNPQVEAALHVALGEACAGLGLADQAVAEGQRAASLEPEAADAWEGPRWTQYLARIYALNGDAQHAAPLIAHLLDTPSNNPLTTATLHLDPVWDAIRHDPRFQALLKQYGTHVVVEAPAAGDAPRASTASEASHD
jgi:tetratricopeptide (TPR) repeat protein